MQRRKTATPQRERGSSPKNSTPHELICDLCKKPIELGRVWTLHAKYDYLCYDCFVNINPK